jgi:hypothetical protein
MSFRSLHDVTFTIITDRFQRLFRSEHLPNCCTPTSRPVPPVHQPPVPLVNRPHRCHLSTGPPIDRSTFIGASIFLGTSALTFIIQYTFVSSPSLERLCAYIFAFIFMLETCLCVFTPRGKKRDSRTPVLPCTLLILPSYSPRTSNYGSLAFSPLFHPQLRGSLFVNIPALTLTLTLTITQYMEKNYRTVSAGSILYYLVASYSTL